MSSQTIGVEFSSKIIKVGNGPRRKRIKLQLWDTAGTERFRSISRSFYRGAAGAILVYDLASHESFNALPNFLSDARALASPYLTLLLAGNKSDLSVDGFSNGNTPDLLSQSPSSTSSRLSAFPIDSGGKGPGVGRGGLNHSSIVYGLGSQQTATRALDGREVTQEEASRWASKCAIPVSVEVSALTGDGVEELFSRLARIILTKIEVGEIDPDDPMSGIQYGDSSGWGEDGDGGSVKSGATTNDEGKRRRRGRGRPGTGRWGAGMREWQAVFRLDGSDRRRGACC